MKVFIAWVLIIAGLTAPFASSVHGATYYVTTNGNNGSPGTNWTTAKATIHAAVSIAQSGDSIVASNGTWVFTNSISITNSIALSSLNGAEHTIISGNNATRIFTMNSTGAVIQGFTIQEALHSVTGTAGTATVHYGGPGISQGGAVYVATGGIIRACIFRSNLARAQGGDGLDGQYYYPTNTMNGGPAYAYGGAIYARAPVVIVQCQFISNMAYAVGGEGGGSAMTGNNWLAGDGGDAYSHGGAVYLAAGANMASCLFRNNSSSAQGGNGGFHYNMSGYPGDAYAYGGSVSMSNGATIANCTMASNSVAAVGGMDQTSGTPPNPHIYGTAVTYGGGLYRLGTSRLVNSILVYNTGSTSSNYSDNGLGTISNCCVMPVPTNAVNSIQTEPQFINSTTNYRLSVNSPCRDKGINNAALLSSIDLDGNPRVQNWIVDMGAYEFVPTYNLQVLGNNLLIPSGSLTVSTTNLTDYGAVNVVGEAVTNTYTITNGSTASVGVGIVTTSGTHAADYVVLSQPVTPIAIGGTTSFRIKYDPSAAGARTATIQFTNTVPGQTSYTFAVQGTGVWPSISISPDAIVATAMVGSVVGPQVFAVSNAGEGSLTYQITNDVAWLSSSPTSGLLAATQSHPHTNTFTITGMSTGTYLGVNTVLSANASNSPQAVPVTLVLTRGTQSISFATLGSQAWTSRVGLAATANSGLPVSFAVASGPASITDGTNLTFSATGSVSIMAFQLGNPDYFAAPAVFNNFDVTKGYQTISFPPIDNQTYTSKVGLAATSSVGLPIAFSVTGGPGVINDGTNLSFSSTGRVTVVASQPGNSDYFAASNVTNSFEVNKAPQTITFPPIGDQSVNNLVGLAATASSGLPVNFAVASGPATIAGNTNLSFTSTGAVTVAAFQSGNAFYEAAFTEYNIFTVWPAPEITTTALPSGMEMVPYNAVLTATNGVPPYSWSVQHLLGPLPSGLECSTSGVLSGLPTLAGTYSVAFVLQDSSGASTGSVIDIEIASNPNTRPVIDAYSPIQTPLSVLKNGSIEFSVAASDPEGQPLSYGWTWDGAQVGENNSNFNYFATADAVGMHELRCYVSDDLWTNVVHVSWQVEVLDISLAQVYLLDLSQTYDGVVRTVTATTMPAGLTVAITYDGSAPAPTNAGSYAVTGTVDDVMYQGFATGTLVVAKADQAIAFPAIGDQLTTDAAGLAATASSGLPVSFDVASGPASISGGTNLTFTGAGAVSIVASQDGDANWNSAADVTNTFSVSKASQSALVFAPASPQTYNTTNALSMTGGSGTGTVNYAVLSGPGEIVGADGLKATSGTGEIVVQATKAADDLYLAQTASATVTAAKASQTIDSFLPTNGSTFNTASAAGLSAAASSGLSVSFTVAGSDPGSIADGTNLTFTGAGTVRVVASQGGDLNFNPAPNVTNSYLVNGLTFYVAATGGNDANTGLSWATAKQTIPATLDQTRSGDAVVVSNGTYGAIAVSNAVCVESVNGATNTIISGMAAGTRGAYLASNAVLIGFTVEGAQTDSNGAGIYAEPGAQIRRCIIRNNTTSQDGGAIYGGSLVNCLLVGNAAANGGGAANADLNHCTVAGNLGTVSGGGTKGCVVLNSIVQRNAPDDWSGGSATYSCALPLPAGAGNIDGDPAFVDMPKGDFRLAYESPCLGAASASGVNIDLAGSPRPQPKVYGGELASDMGCYEYVPQARFVWTNGNAVAPYESWQDAANDIQTALDISSGGDRIVVEAGTYAPFTVSNAVVLLGYRGASNTVVDGGGILRPITITAPATLESFTVQNGAADDCGGILADNGAVLRDIHIANSQATAPGGYGGGLCLYNGSKAENVVVVSNQAQYGAGIYATSTSEVHSSIIAWNISGSGWGGGVYLEDAGTLDDSLVEGNSSARGGGVYANGSEIALSTIRGNLASEYGGGVALFGGTLRYSWIEDNDSGNGAGIYATDALGHSCVVAGNIASGQGGGVYLDGTSAFYNLTIVTNQAVTGGGGVWLNDSDRLWNSIVMFNSPSNLVPGSGDIQYSCIAPPPAGTGNFEDDPLFVSTNDFHLRSGSSCVDAGTNENWMAENQDIDGQRRVYPAPADEPGAPVRDIWIDIGADEASLDAFSRPSPSDPFWGWNVVLDATLQMQTTTNLLFPLMWVDAGNSFIATQSMVALPHAATNRMRYFRLIWEKP